MLMQRGGSGSTWSSETTSTFPSLNVVLVRSFNTGKLDTVGGVIVAER